MEGEDSFEAIVAKAVYEVNRNQLLCLSGLKLLLALARFIAALEALRHPKSQHLSHTVVWIWSHGGASASWQAILVPAVRTRPAGENPPPTQKLGRCTVLSRMDAIARATVMPPRRYQYFLITSSAELVVPSGRMIQSPRHCASVGCCGFPSAPIVTTTLTFANGQRVRSVRSACTHCRSGSRRKPHRDRHFRRC